MHRSAIRMVSSLREAVSSRLRQKPNLGRIIMPMLFSFTLHPLQLISRQPSFILCAVNYTQPCALQVIFSLIWIQTPLKEERGTLAITLPQFYSCTSARAVRVRLGLPTFPPSNFIWCRWQNLPLILKLGSRQSFQAQVKVLPAAPCIQAGELPCTDDSHRWREQSPKQRSPSKYPLWTWRVQWWTFLLRMGSLAREICATLSSQLSEFSMALFPIASRKAVQGSLLQSTTTYTWFEQMARAKIGNTNIEQYILVSYTLQTERYLIGKPIMTKQWNIVFIKYDLKDIQGINNYEREHSIYPHFD